MKGRCFSTLFPAVLSVKLADIAEGKTFSSISVALASASHFFGMSRAMRKSSTEDNFYRIDIERLHEVQLSVRCCSATESDYAMREISHFRSRS